ncbi:hypothetical protein RA19_03295 [Leisingera sp. ANG-M1]|nr:hypothetical protein RA19_03295 [Leisingera sp. ANG-M1]
MERKALGVAPGLRPGAGSVRSAPQARCRAQGQKVIGAAKRRLRAGARRCQTSLTGISPRRELPM